MSTQAHTLGPWEAVGHKVIAGQFAFLQTSNFGAPREIWEANARLIAAAPDMLAALKAMLPENNDDPVNLGRPTFETCEQARAAIAKAEGTA